jgi:hypothetical protein
MAGGPGDRWLGHRKMAGREESPDTVLRHVDRAAFILHMGADLIGVNGARSTELLTGRRAW